MTWADGILGTRSVENGGEVVGDDEWRSWSEDFATIQRPQMDLSPAHQPDRGNAPHQMALGRRA